MKPLNGFITVVSAIAGFWLTLFIISQFVYQGPALVFNDAGSTGIWFADGGWP